MLNISEDYNYMATGTSTSNQWKAAALAAEDAAFKADQAAFAAEQSVLDAKANVYRAQLAVETATTQQNPAALAAAKQQLTAAQNSVITSTAAAGQVREQSNNANAAADAASAKAAENASNPVAETTPLPAAATTGSPTSYQYVPATVTPVTSPSPKPEATFSASSVTTSSYSTSTSVVVENTTGGGSVTTVSTPAIATPKSTALQSQADVAQKQADLLSLNPNTAFGQRALDRKLAEGTITQDQYDYVKGLSNEDRIAAKNAELNKAIELQTQANSATFQPPPTVTTTPNLNTTEVTVTNIKTESLAQSTTLNGEVSGYNVSTETIDGVQYQITSNDTTETVQNATPELVPAGGGNIPYDELGNLNPGWEQDELGTAYYVGTDMVPKTAPTPIPPGPNANAQSDPYDELGNLNPGWNVDELGTPYWVGFGEVQTEPKTPPIDTPTGPAYDDEGNLMPGWSLNEDSDPVWVGNNADGTIFVEPATKDSAQQSYNSAKGVLAAKTSAQTKATNQDQVNYTKQEDWRVRLSLSPSATYLYKATPPGILKPLADTNGVIFPYTPSVQVNYAAAYDSTELTHSNYKVYQYKSSSVDNIQISCDFTAQDTFEANYLLAVIHFFRSVTKMFYGQDNGPKPGTPPPLCFLTGLGTFQFNEHPIAITSFNYSLPTDVDYIRAGPTTALAGVNQQAAVTPNNTNNPSKDRLATGGNLAKGGNSTATKWNFSAPPQDTVTYVPTKMQIQISAVPMVSRNDVSNNFSLADYANGKLLRGVQNVRGGFW